MSLTIVSDESWSQTDYKIQRDKYLYCGDGRGEKFESREKFSWDKLFIVGMLVACALAHYRLIGGKKTFAAPSARGAGNFRV